MTGVPHILLAGIGSPNGDDQVGWRIAERLRERLASAAGITVRKAAVPLDLLDWIENVQTLHIVDACLSDEPTGSIIQLTADASRSGPAPFEDLLSRLAQLATGSSHDFGLSETLHLAARLGRLPDRVVVHAIAARQFELASRMSDELTRRLPEITHTLFQELTHARSLARAVAAEPG